VHGMQDRMLEYLEGVSGPHPEVVYHYTTQDGFLGILRSKVLWASNAMYLNDSSELNYGVQVFDKVRAAWVAGSTDARKVRLDEIWRDVLSRQLEAGVYVVAFSVKRDDLAQWRAYGGHTGYCLGFSTTDLLLRAQAMRPPGTFLRCLYLESEQRAAAEQMIALLHANCDPGIPDQARTDFRGLLFMVASCFKHPSFKDEGEWRLFFLPERRTPEVLEFRPGRGFLIPYRSVPMETREFAPQLKNVMVGPTPHPELARPAAWNACTSLGWNLDEVRVTEAPFRSW